MEEPHDETTTDYTRVLLDDDTNHQPWQRMVATFLQNYLPPPVVRVMRLVDSHLYERVGPDASVTLLVSVLLCVLLYQILSKLRPSANAIVDDDDNDTSKRVPEQHYDESILLIGPSHGGKTRLWFALTEGRPDVPTLTSQTIQSKVIASSNERSVLYVDVPGHMTLSDVAVLKTVLSDKKPSRIVFVLDATQPVRAAADKLFELLEIISTTLQQQQQSSPILIACHQCDKPKCKTIRRLQLQLRSELEKLHSIQETTWWTGQFDEKSVQFCNSSVHETQSICDFLAS